MSLESLKKFGRIEYDGDDETLELCMSAAIDMLTTAGVVAFNNALYEMAVCRLALHYYENREELSNFKEVPFGIGTMIEQLRNSEEV